MKNLQKNLSVVFIILGSIWLTACDQKDKTPSKEASTVNETTSVTTAEAEKTTEALTPQATQGNYQVTIITKLMGGEQSAVLKNVALPSNENEFCQNKEFLQKNLPEGSSMTACSFAGTTGQASFLFKIGEQNIETDTTYNFEPI